MILRKTKEMRHLVAVLTVVLSATLGAAFVPATVHATDVAQPDADSRNDDGSGPLAVGYEPGFLEVRYDGTGTLWYYAHEGGGFTGYPVDGGGWDQTSHVALLDVYGHFVEVKGDVLRHWKLNYDGSRFYVTFIRNVDTGWSNTKLITGIGNVTGDGGPEFIQIRTNGDLMLYRSQGDGFLWERWLDNGYENARLIAGLGGHGRFVLINNQNDLWEYTLTSGKPHGERRMSGWHNVRLLGPGGHGFSFVSVRYNDQLVQWAWGCTQTCNYQPIFHYFGWGNARLIG